MTKKIGLPSGDVALVSDEDLDRVAEWAWRKHKVKENNIYVQRANPGDKPGIHLHRFIMNAPEGVMVDHIDGNGLNNQRDNLRLCTNQQNLFNRRPNKRSKHGYKGIYYNRRGADWGATLTTDGHRYFLGLYRTKEEAAKAYDKKAKELYGEFAYLNFKD